MLVRLQLIRRYKIILLSIFLHPVNELKRLNIPIEPMPKCYFGYMANNNNHSLFLVEDDDLERELVELTAEDSSDSDQQQQLDLDNVLQDNLDDIEGVVGQCSALLRRTKEAETTDSPVSDQDHLDKVLITV